MIIESFAAGPWATNCYLVAPAPDSEAIVIDPGFDSLTQIQNLVAKHRLHPVAALLTHGHMDHVWSVVPLCKSHQIPAMINKRDSWMLENPAAAYPAASWREILNLTQGEVDFFPKEILYLEDNKKINLTVFDVEAIATPGHTQGSMVFKFDNTLFSGDTLFNQGIGRTDLPGGDEAQMRKSLKEVILPMNDQIKVYPGHGPSTTIGDERKHNIFLRELTK